jgi:hypothetical protein
MLDFHIEISNVRVLVRLLILTICKHRKYFTAETAEVVDLSLRECTAGQASRLALVTTGESAPRPESPIRDLAGLPRTREKPGFLCAHE